MTRLVILLAALFLPQNSGSIEGVVVYGSTDRPVANAQLELTQIEGGRVVSRMANADSEGRFSFRNLPGGDGYQLVVRGSGLRATAYGQRTLADPWKPINLDQGQQLKDVRITAQAVSQMRGRVLDNTGKPLANARVLAMTPVYVGGRRQLQNERNAQTDLRGEFRFLDLDPGLYYVRVRPQNDSEVEALFEKPTEWDQFSSDRRGIPFSREPEGYPTVYYPGTSIEAAKVIVLTDGQRQDDLTITVTKVRTSRVRGRTLDEASSRLAPSRVTLVPVDSSPDSSWARSFNAKDGNFDFRAVQPGDYFLTALTTGTNPPMSRRMKVTIRSGENPTFDVPVSSLPDIDGQIAIEGPAGEGADLSSVSISLIANTTGPADLTIPHANIGTGGIGAIAAKDGKFSFTSVVPADYRVVVSKVPRTYVKTIRLDNDDVLERGVRLLDNQHRRLNIVLGTDPGRVDGRVLNEKGQDASGARVVMVPAARHRRDLYIAGLSSSTGRFQMDVPPGRYKVFAWEGPPEGAWTDPDFLSFYEERGVMVDVASEGSEFVEVKLIP
jgi:protocatechuate 3,4-dioxygenase beta subunit